MSVPLSTSLFLRRRIALFLLASASSAACPWTSLSAAENDLPVSSAPLLAAAAPAPVAPAPLSGRVSPSQNVTINLINRLVERGVLPKEDAESLIKMAEQDAADARAQAAATEAASREAGAALAAAASVRDQLASAGPLPLAPELSAPPAPLPPAGPDTVRVTYIPEVVKAQMRAQIKDEVMAQAREENWAAPRSLPEWVTRFKLFGDVRIRGEGLYYDGGNDNTGAFPNFNAINTGAPYDVSGTVFAPQLNVDQDRQRIRLRARLGIEADLGEGFSAGLRIATGENNTPVSTNQSFGLANQGQGGNFSKYAIWLDRAFLKYELGAEANKRLTLLAGRFDNPFFSTDMIWDDDVGFDGFAVQGRYQVTKSLTPFLTAGAFPVFNTDLNFSSIQPAKFESTDKWLYAVQAGTDWKIAKDLKLKLAAAYYHFEDIEGVLSDPFTPLNAQDAGNTDNTRPSFAQKGNTYMALRDIVANANNGFGTLYQYQYFGLATPFRELALTGRLDYTHFEPFVVSLVGEYVKNLAFNRPDIDRIAVNNRGEDSSAAKVGAFSGGDTAWFAGIKVGSAGLDKRWDWQVALNYRYVESDSVVDGFTDSDFGGGGTNFKGFSLGGAVALSPRVSVGVRWMSANSIDGPPVKNDVLQVDLSGKF